MKTKIFYLSMLLAVMVGGVSDAWGAYSGTYPYKWDFTVSASEWATSINQMKNSSGNWNIEVDNNIEKRARPTMALSETFFINDIDIIKGLGFKTPDAGALCLDWSFPWMWLNGSVTLPGLSRGNIVTIVSEANPQSETPTLVAPSGLTSKNVTNDGTKYISVYVADNDIPTPEFVFKRIGIFSIDVRTSIGQLADLSFVHHSGKVTAGRTITPYMKTPDANYADFTSIVVSVVEEKDANGNPATPGTIVQLGAGESRWFWKQKSSKI